MKQTGWNKTRLGMIVIGTGIIIVLSISFFYLPYIVREVKNPVAGLFNDTLRKVVPPDFGRYGLKGESFYFRTRDSLRMSAYRIPSDTAVKGTVIALHGYRSNKNKYLPVIPFFTSRGYDFIAVDLRGHNMSEGDYTGFSYLEKKDINDLIDYLRRENLIRGKLILYGHSIGAATAVGVASEREDVDALVLESLFTSFDKIIPNYINFYTGVNADSLPNQAEKFIFDKIKIPADSIRPVDQAEKIDIPVLLIHGAQDKKVPLKHAEKMYERLKGPKKLIVIDSATHNTLWERGGDAYFDTILRFLDTTVTAQSSFSNSL